MIIDCPNCSREFYLYNEQFFCGYCCFKIPMDIIVKSTVWKIGFQEELGNIQSPKDFDIEIRKCTPKDHRREARLQKKNQETFPNSHNKTLFCIKCGELLSKFLPKAP